MAAVRRGAGSAAPAAPAAAVDESQLEGVASWDPDTFSSGGLKDDFDGRILKARLCPWDYNGSIENHVLAVALTIKPDDEDEPFVQHYSAGDLEHFVPSMDGKTSVPLDKEGATDEELEGVYALKVGKRDVMSNSSNWSMFVTKLLDAQFPKGLLRPAVTFVEGTYGHFNRIPQKKRSGIVPTPAKEGKTKSNDILVMTEIKEVPGPKTGAVKAAAPAAPKTAAPAAPTPPPAAAAASSGDLDTRIEAVIIEALRKTGDEGMNKSELASLMLTAFTGKDKAFAVKKVNDAKFLEGSDAFAYDPDTGTLYAL